MLRYNGTTQDWDQIRGISQIVMAAPFNIFDMTEQTEKKEPLEVKISEIKALMDQGYSRYIYDDRGYGSIQDKYKLTKTEVKDIFSHPKLKGLKTKPPKVKVVDDTSPAPAPSATTEDIFS